MGWIKEMGVKKSLIYTVLLLLVGGILGVSVYFIGSSVLEKYKAQHQQIDAQALVNKLAILEQGIVQGNIDNNYASLLDNTIKMSIQNEINLKNEDTFVPVEELINKAEESQKESILSNIVAKGQYTNPTDTDFYNPTDDLATEYDNGKYDKYKNMNLDPRIETVNSTRGVYLHSLTTDIQKGNVTLSIYGTEQNLDLMQYRDSKYNVANTGITYNVQNYALYDDNTLEVTYTVTNAEGETRELNYVYKVSENGTIISRELLNT